MGFSKFGIFSVRKGLSFIFKTFNWTSRSINKPSLSEALTVNWLIPTKV